MPELKDSDLHDLLSPLFAQELALYGFDHISFAGGADHDGDPVVFAILRYRHGAPKLSTDVFLDAVVEAMRLLKEHGDQRFLHVRHEYVDGEAVIDDEGRRARRRAG
jgi:hypothetical protein